MRVLACGDRDWRDEKLLAEVLDSLPIKVLIEGECRGADIIAAHWAFVNSLDIERYPADWDTYDKRAGHIRNTQMLEEGKPDLVVAFHNHIEKSSGTANMLCQAEDAGVLYCLVEGG